MRNAFFVGGALLIAACGGKVESAPEPVQAAASTYTLEHVDSLFATGAGELIQSAVGCHDGGSLVSGGCSVTGRGDVIDSGPLGQGWACAVANAVDGDTLKTWATCALP